MWGALRSLVSSIKVLPFKLSDIAAPTNALIKRALKFDIVPASSDELSKQQQRTQRFGVTESNGDVSAKKARTEGVVDAALSTEEEEKRRQRALRFAGI